jgi:hypothetical protein
MFSKIEHWKGSGQSPLAFCKSQNLSISVFQYWRKKHLDQQGTIATSAFVPITIQTTDRGVVAELIFPNGKRIHFYQQVEVSVLRTLLS